MSWFEEGLKKLKDHQDEVARKANKGLWLQEALDAFNEDVEQDKSLVCTMGIRLVQADKVVQLLKNRKPMGAFAIAPDGVSFTAAPDSGLSNHTSEDKEDFKRFLIDTAFKA